MKVVQISILARVYGNVNADETVGNRITIKKMYDGEGNIYPFISARAIKFAIRKRLEEKGFKIDPFYLQNNMLEDSGKPWEYVDNDLFGYMKPNERKRRTAPVAISYFKALRNTTISTEFGARFPRQEGTNPAPFEIEVADIIGKLNVLIYDYIGRESVLDNEKWEAPINEDERKKRIKALLEILLIERFVLPKRTNSLNIPEYYYALLVQSEKGPLPIYQYLDYSVLEDGKPKLDVEKLKTLDKLLSDKRNKDTKLYLIDYIDGIKEEKIGETQIEVIKVDELRSLIDQITNWL